MTRHATAAVVAIALALATGARAQPQDALGAARFALTGPVEREWVFKQIQVFMGPSNRCQQGEALRFLARRQVVIESCVDGVMTRRMTSWALKANGVLDPILSLDGGAYLLSFSDSGSNHYMRLRKPGADPADPAVDREYRLSAD